VIVTASIPSVPPLQATHQSTPGCPSTNSSIQPQPYLPPHLADRPPITHRLFPRFEPPPGPPPPASTGSGGNQANGSGSGRSEADDLEAEAPPAYTPAAYVYQGESTLEVGPRRPFQQVPAQPRQRHHPNHNNHTWPQKPNGISTKDIPAKANGPNLTRLWYLNNLERGGHPTAVH